MICNPTGWKTYCSSWAKGPEHGHFVSTVIFNWVTIGGKEPFEKPSRSTKFKREIGGQFLAACPDASEGQGDQRRIQEEAIAPYKSP
jgi:hypothetical protein